MVKVICGLVCAAIAYKCCFRKRQADGRHARNEYNVRRGGGSLSEEVSSSVGSFFYNLLAAIFGFAAFWLLKDFLMMF